MEKLPTRTPAEPVSLLKARTHSEHVKEVAQDAAADLSSVSTSLQKQVDQAQAASPAVQEALDQCEVVEEKVGACVEELSTANAALSEGIRERRVLHDELSKTHEALTQSRRQARKARSDALHDPLTGLPNFTLFKDRLELALAAARRHGRQFAVMFLDLDKFKTVNDVHGHHVGDACLQGASRRLESVTRAEDTVSRRSGDEFQFLMMEASDLPVITAMATKLSQVISGTSCDVGPVKLALKASIGIAVYPGDGHSAQELLEKADAAMYDAKHRGGPPTFWRELKTLPHQTPLVG